MKNLIEKNARVEYWPAVNGLQVSLSGFIPYETMIQIFQHEFNMIRHYRIRHCLIDLRGIQVYAPGVSDFIRDVWFPQVRQDGVQFIAFLVPASAFGTASMYKAHQQVSTQQGMQVGYFPDLSAAQQWLLEQQPTVPTLR